MLVTQTEDVFPLLKPHVLKCTRSYKQLIIDLAATKEMRSGIDFYMCAARLFIGEPMVLIKPKRNPNYIPGEPGPEYLFEKQYLLEADKFLSLKNIKIRMVFKGIDFYAPFYPDRIGAVVKEGIPVLWDICKAHEGVCNIIQKMAPGKSINAGLRTIQLYLGAAVAIADTTNFATGDSNPAITDQPVSTLDPLIHGTVRRKRKTASKEETVPSKKSKPSLTATASEQPEKDLVDISEHVRQLDKAGQSTQEVDKNQPTQSNVPEEQGEKAGDEESEKVQETDEVLPSADRGENQCVCGSNFDTVELLKIHYGIDHANHSYKCSGTWLLKDGTEVDCTKEFKKPGSMWRHYRSQHGNRYYFYCAVVDCKEGKHGERYGADNYDAVKKHMHKVHKIVSDLKCTKCEYVASAKYRLREHMETCKVDKNIKKYGCDKCEKRFRQKGGLSIHTRQDHPLVPGDLSAFFHCDKCTKYFRTASGKRKHMENEHGPDGKKKKKKQDKGQKETEKADDGDGADDGGETEDAE